MQRIYAFPLFTEQNITSSLHQFTKDNNRYFVKDIVLFSSFSRTQRYFQSTILLVRQNFVGLNSHLTKNTVCRSYKSQAWRIINVRR